MRRSMREWLVLLAPPTVGLVLGCVVAFTTSAQASVLWLVWAPLAVGLGLAAGATLPYGVNRWRELANLFRVAPRAVVVPTIAVGLVGIVVPLVTAFMSGPAHIHWRVQPLVAFAILASLPTAAVMFGVRHVALTASPALETGATLALLMALRRLHQRSLAALGSLAGLVILQFGALLAFERSVGSDFGSRPPEYILVFGGFSSLLVALVYVPGWSVLQRCGSELCERLFPVAALDEALAIASAVESRQKIEQALGVNQSLVADMQSGVIILAPLVASAAAVFLPD